MPIKSIYHYCRYLTLIAFTDILRLSDIQLNIMPYPTHPIVTAAQVGLLLQSARKSRGMTQGQLAARVGISQNRLSELERAPGTFSLDQLLALCGQLGLQLTLDSRAEGASAPAGTSW